jgi:hypothetical protein
VDELLLRQNEDYKDQTEKQQRAPVRQPDFCDMWRCMEGWDEGGGTKG